jgi:hypothetical protein
MPQSIEPTIRYDFTNKRIVVRWPWFRSHGFPLNEKSMDKLFSSLDAFYRELHKRSIFYAHGEPNPITTQDMLLIREALERGVLKKIASKGKSRPQVRTIHKLTLDELFGGQDD